MGKTNKDLFEQNWYNYFKNNKLIQSQWTTNNLQFTNFKVFSEYFKTNNLDLIIQSTSDGNRVETDISTLNRENISFNQIKESVFWGGSDPDSAKRQSLNEKVGGHVSLQDYLDVNKTTDNMIEKSKENAIIVSYEANKLLDSLNLYIENTDISISIKENLIDNNFDSYINGLLNSKDRSTKNWKEVIDNSISTASKTLLNFDYFNTIHYPYLLKTSIPFEKSINNEKTIQSLNIDVHPHEVLGLDNKANIQKNIFFAFRKPITTDIILKLENAELLSSRQVKDLKRLYMYNSHDTYTDSQGSYNQNPFSESNRYNTFDDEKHSLVFVVFLNYETNKLEISVYYSDSYLVNLSQVLSYFNKDGFLLNDSYSRLKELVSFNVDLHKNSIKLNFIPIFKYSLFSNNYGYYDYTFPMYTLGTLNLDYTSNKLKIQDTIEKAQQVNLLAITQSARTINNLASVDDTSFAKEHTEGDTKITTVSKELVKDLNNNGKYIPPSESLGFLQMLLQGEEKLKMDMENTLNFTIPRFGLNTIAPTNKSFYDNIIGINNIVKTSIYQSLFILWLSNENLRKNISFEQLDKINNLLKVVIYTPDQKDKENEQQLEAIKSGASSKNDLGQIGTIVKQVQAKNRN